MGIVFLEIHTITARCVSITPVSLHKLLVTATVVISHLTAEYTSRGLPHTDRGYVHRPWNFHFPAKQPQTILFTSLWASVSRHVPNTQQTQ